MSRVAAIYDIHGNLPALEAVLNAIADASVDQIVVGGDVLPGPMPHETLARLVDLDVPTLFIYGNGELGVLAQRAAADPNEVTYWGTSTGAPLPEPLREVLRWTARQLTDEDDRLIASWPMTITLDVAGLGNVLFCHATPRNEVEIFTRLTPDERLLPIFESSGASLVVCGHTHMQFDRMIGRTRVVNAGSVGMPFGEPGAYWLLLDDDVKLQRTEYDLDAAAASIRQTRYPQADAFATRNVLHPPTEREILEAFSKAEIT